MTINPDGRRSGSREPDPSCTGSGPSGFDPERCSLVQELAEALDGLIKWYGKRDNAGDDSLLPPADQEDEMAAAMEALAKARAR